MGTSMSTVLMPSDPDRKVPKHILKNITINLNRAPCHN